MTGKSYSTKNGQKRDPVWFELDGERFDCRPMIGGLVLTDMGGKMYEAQEADDMKGALIAVQEILDFLEHAMGETEYARFRAFTDAPERTFELELLGEIVKDLLTTYVSRRPLVPSSPSPSGLPSNGITSTPAANWPVSTSEHSQQTVSSESSTT